MNPDYKRKFTKTKLICGFGINDADYNVQRWKKIDGKNTRLWICPYYSIWKSMIERVYSEKKNSYEDVQICPEWKYFSNFREWAIENNFKQGLQLDKDIFSVTNKIYSPVTCCFVPNFINTFLASKGKPRGKYPLGVCKSSSNGKYYLSISDPDKGSYAWFGLYETVDEAVVAYKKQKYKHLIRVLSKWEESEYDLDIRVAERLFEIYEYPKGDYSFSELISTLKIGEKA